MDITLLYKSLNEEEKRGIFKLLAEEFLKAPRVEGYITVEEFCSISRVSTRLKNVLLQNKEWLGAYIEIIDPKEIQKCRNASINTANEFIKARDYFIFQKLNKRHP